jgi:putative ABC transport system substrate-binding protein
MKLCLQRREFIAGLGGAAAWPLAARAQQQTKPTVGWLYTRPGGLLRSNSDAFRRGLAEIGFLEGRDVTVEYLTAEGHLDQLPALAADLVRRRVAVIFAVTSDSALAAKAATRTIPVVFVVGDDPVELGLVASLNRPGGNLTGTYVLSAETAAKRLELLHKAMPAAESIAMLSGPADSQAEASVQREVTNVQSAARTLGLRLLLSNATTDGEIAAAFATIVERQAGAVLVGGSVQLVPRTEQIISLAARYRLPAMFVYNDNAREDNDNAREGGLLSYGPVVSESIRQAGAYTGRILKGEKLTDLPVQLSTRFHFIINLKTARGLGLEIPPLLLALADEVIE